MALIEDQQAQINLQETLEANRRVHEQQMEAVRQSNALAIATMQKEAQIASIEATAKVNAEFQATQTRLEAVRLAKETLLENARSKPVDSRDVSATDIQAFAQTLVSYINR